MWNSQYYWHPGTHWAQLFQVTLSWAVCLHSWPVIFSTYASHLLEIGQVVVLFLMDTTLWHVTSTGCQESKQRKVSLPMGFSFFCSYDDVIYAIIWRRASLLVQPQKDTPSIHHSVAASALDDHVSHPYAVAFNMIVLKLQHSPLGCTLWGYQWCYRICATTALDEESPAGASGECSLINSNKCIHQLLSRPCQLNHQEISHS